MQPYQNTTFTIKPADRAAAISWLNEAKENITQDQIQKTRDNDVIEGALVHTVVLLISRLANHTDSIRISSARLLFKIAFVFQKIDSKKLDRVILAIEHQEENSIHNLFTLIAPGLSTFSIPVISGLECFYTAEDPTTRSTCVSALSRLVFENSAQISNEDRLAAVWNLFFSLNWLPVSTLFPNRLVSINALGLLSQVYVSDSPLTYRIMDGLFRLKNKTLHETDAIKVTLALIFEKYIAFNVSTDAEATTSNIKGL